MTFGRFMNKWRLFQRIFQVKWKHAGKVYMCAARLFNFCANETLAQQMNLLAMADEERVHDALCGR